MTAQRPHQRQLMRMTVWTSMALLAFELGIYAATALSAGGPENSLLAQFHRGYSIETTLRDLVGSSDAGAHPVAFAGWRDHEIANPFMGHGNGEEASTDVTIYGMSFAGQIGDALRDLDPGIRTRLLAGPAAPPNFTYAAFEADDRRDTSDVLIWAVLASSLTSMYSLTGQTMGLEQPFPYTFPRYDLVHGQLVALEPMLGSLAEMRQAMSDVERWGAWRNQLQAHDATYSDFLYRQGWWDRSALLRLVRSGWAQRVMGKVESRYRTRDGIDPDSLPGRVLPIMAREFARTVRSEGRLPIVMLVHDRGQGSAVHQLLEETLESYDIPYVSTHDLVPPDDPSQFLRDGHFTEDANRRVAARLRRIIRAQTPQ